MADEKKKDAVEKAEKKAKATKADKADKANKPKKPNIFVRAGKAIARFFKDFRGEIKKITWPDAKTVLKSTGVVIAVILIIGIGIWIVDFGLSQGLSPRQRPPPQNQLRASPMPQQVSFSCLAGCLVKARSKRKGGLTWLTAQSGM